MGDLKEQIFSRLFNLGKIWMLFALHSALKRTIRGTLAIANSSLESDRFQTFQTLHFIPNFSLSHFWISVLISIRSSQELWHIFEVGRYHPPSYSGGEQRHRQDKAEVIPSPLSGGPTPHTDSDSFPRVQAITPALHWFKAQLSTAVDTDLCCTSDLSEWQAQESEGGTSGDHSQSLVRNDTNPFAKSGFAKKLLLESLFLSPLTHSSLHQPFPLQWKRAAAPLIHTTQHCSFREQEAAKAPMKSTHKHP